MKIAVIWVELDNIMLSEVNQNKRDNLSDIRHKDTKQGSDKEPKASELEN